MRIFGIVGWNNAGKTTLLVNLLPEMIRRGFKVSTIKHGQHDLDVDQPGKDSYRHREAGASEVLVASARRWALMHELRGQPEATLEELLGRLSPVDLVLVEGFKHHAHDKLEVHRAANGKPLICRDDPRVVAVAGDRRIAGLAIPFLDLDDVPAIAEFIVRHCRLEARSRHGAP